MPRALGKMLFNILKKEVNVVIICFPDPINLPVQQKDDGEIK